MKKITQEELNIILEEHKKWLADKNKGKCADLSDADLSDADLSVANLKGANLKGANLKGANLSVANLSGADLSVANLSVANLSGADLSVADLSYADLRSCIGNGKEIKTIYIDKYIINYTTDILSIGFEQHSTEVWKNFTDKKIAKMDNTTLKWWKKWKEWIFNTIKLSPAEK